MESGLIRNSFRLRKRILLSSFHFLMLLLTMIVFLKLSLTFSKDFSSCSLFSYPFLIECTCQSIWYSGSHLWKWKTWFPINPLFILQKPLKSWLLLASYRPPLCERDLGLLWTWKSSWYNESGGFSVPWDKSGIRDDCVIGYDFSGRNKFESWIKKSISCIFVKTITGNRFCSKGLGIMLFVLFKNDFCFLFPDCIYDRGFEDYLGYFFHLCWQE